MSVGLLKLLEIPQLLTVPDPTLYEFRVKAVVVELGRAVQLTIKSILRTKTKFAVNLLSCTVKVPAAEAGVTTATEAAPEPEQVSVESSVPATQLLEAPRGDKAG
jgi:hypothetical protein